MFRVGAECTEHPVVLIVTEHQGLTQITHIPYTHETDGRRTLSTAKRCSTRTMRLCLQLLFTPEVWVRHQYSLEDVVDTLNYFKSNQLWKLAVLLGIPLSNSSVKISHSSPTSMVFSSKAIVMVKIVAFLRKHYIFPDKSVLDKTHDDHVPQLPVHHIPASEYYKWKALAPSEPNAISVLKKNTVEEFFDWNGIQMVPMALEGDHIYMIRVVRADVFEKSQRDHHSMAARPFHFLLDDVLFYGCIDESAFFLPQAGP